MIGNFINVQRKYTPPDREGQPSVHVELVSLGASYVALLVLTIFQARVAATSQQGSETLCIAIPQEKKSSPRLTEYHRVHVRVRVHVLVHGAPCWGAAQAGRDLGVGKQRQFCRPFDPLPTPSPLLLWRHLQHYRLSL